MPDIKQDKEEPEATRNQKRWRVNPSHAKPQMSRGEKIYNWVIYKGINYWVNLISSLAIADYFISGRGKVKLDKGAEALGKLVASTGMASGEKAVHHARTALKTSALTSGGWALLIPGTYAENHKRPIVHWMNKSLGVKQIAPDGHEETPDEIYIEQEQPHQSFANAVKRRTMAWLSVVGTGYAINTLFRDRKNAGTHAPGEDDYHGGKAVVERFVVNNVNKQAKKILPEGHWFIRENGTAQRWLGLAALDTLFTKITATVMHVTNGAHKEKMPHEIGEDDAPPGNDATPNVITTELAKAKVIGGDGAALNDTYGSGRRTYADQAEDQRDTAKRITRQPRAENRIDMLKTQPAPLHSV